MSGDAIILSQRLAVLGYTGVHVFFALSGYLIYSGLIQKARPYWKYLGRRLQRIYPAYLTMLLLHVLICIAVPSLRKWPAEAMARFIYFAKNITLIPFYYPTEPILTVSWTLSVELTFYLTIPLIIVVAGLREWNKTGRAILWAAVILVAALVQKYSSTSLGEIMMFCAGMLAFEIRQIRASKGNEPLMGELAAIALFVVACILVFSREPNAGPRQNQVLFGDKTTLLVCCSLAGLVWFSLRENGLLRAALSTAPLRFLGRISYSFYLIHGATLNALRVIFFRGGPNEPHLPILVIFPITLGLSVITATALYVLVEYPLSIAQVEKPKRPA